MAKQIVILGVSHRSAPVENRERFARMEDDSELFLQETLAGPVEELALLSTCNRVEVVVAGTDADALEAHLRAALGRLTDVDADWLQAYTRVYRGDAAVQHLFRVASSLDSIVVGEPQILGQVKEAYRRYSRLGATGPILNRVFHRSFHAAKRVRSETGIAENAVSVSWAAVELARGAFADLHEVRVLVIGAGKMGALAARNLKQAGVRSIEVLNRDLERALALERSLGVQAGSLGELRARLSSADIVITSTGAREYVVREADVAAAQEARGHRPLFLIDIAVPRDVDPKCGEIPGVSLYDVDDLERVVVSNLDARRQAARDAEAIVDGEVGEIRRWLSATSTVPTLVALRSHFFALLEDELNRSVRSSGRLDEEEIHRMERFSRQLVRKMLHQPTKALRDAQGVDALALASAASTLFGLGVAPEEDE